MRIAMLLAFLSFTNTLLAQEPTQPSDSKKDLRLGSMAVNRILFLGNSITLHGPAPEIGWTGNFGMAASSEDKDYVHQLVDRISKQSGGRPEFMVRNIADFERTLAAFNINEQLRKELDFKADVVIVAIGENAAKPETNEAREEFCRSFHALLRTIRNHGQPRIFVRSQFWPDQVKDDLMKAATLEEKQTWIDLTGKVDESCYARSERQFDHAGVAGHPGDKGMKVIADAIMTSITNAGQFSSNQRVHNSDGDESQQR